MVNQLLKIIYGTVKVPSSPTTPNSNIFVLKVTWMTRKIFIFAYNYIKLTFFIILTTKQDKYFNRVFFVLNTYCSKFSVEDWLQGGEWVEGLGKVSHFSFFSFFSFSVIRLDLQILLEFLTENYFSIQCLLWLKSVCPTLFLPEGEK